MRLNDLGHTKFIVWSMNSDEATLQEVANFHFQI